MATYSSNILLSFPAQGESGVNGFAHWGALANSNFQFLEDALTAQSQIAVSGADVTLTDAQNRSVSLYIAGALIANVAVKVADTRKGFWFVENATTGAYTVTVRTVSGTGVVVNQGQRAVLYSDGADVVAIFSGPVGDILGTTDTQVVSNKSLIDSSTSFIDNSDNTKAGKFELSHVTTSTTRSVTWPDSGGAMVVTQATGTDIEKYNSNLGELAALDGPLGTLIVGTNVSGVTGVTDWATLPVGADGKVLKVVSGIPAWAGAAKDLLYSNTLSVNSASWTINNLIAAYGGTFVLTDYYMFELVFENLQTTSGSLQTMVGTVSIDNGSNYATAYTDGTSNQTYLLSFNVAIGSATTYGGARYFITGFGDATQPTMARKDFSWRASDVTTAGFTPNTSSDTMIIRRAVEADNTLRLAISGGLIAAGGTVRFYGHRKAL
jgi:hypothetical protein